MYGSLDPGQRRNEHSGLRWRISIWPALEALDTRLQHVLHKAKRRALFRKVPCPLCELSLCPGLKTLAYNTKNFLCRCEDLMDILPDGYARRNADKEGLFAVR